MNFVEIYIIELEILYVNIVQLLLPAPRFRHTVPPTWLKCERNKKGLNNTGDAVFTIFTGFLLIFVNQ